MNGEFRKDPCSGSTYISFVKRVLTCSNSGEEGEKKLLIRRLSLTTRIGIGRGGSKKLAGATRTGIGDRAKLYYMLEMISGRNKRYFGKLLESQYYTVTRNLPIYF